MTERNFARTLASDSIDSEGRNNYVKIRGIIKQSFHYSHEYNGEPYYKTNIFVERESGETYDMIPVFVPKTELKCSFKDEFVEATGILCSYDSHPCKGEHHLNVFFSADTISIVDQSKGYINEVHLQGRVCNKVVLKTKRSGETFVQFFLVLDRKNGPWKYYIPCSSFHNLKDFVDGNIKSGNEIMIKGEFHTRRYYSSSDGKRINMYDVECHDIFAIVESKTGV